MPPGAQGSSEGESDSTHNVNAMSEDALESYVTTQLDKNGESRCVLLSLAASVSGVHNCTVTKTKVHISIAMLGVLCWLYLPLLDQDGKASSTDVADLFVSVFEGTAGKS